MEIQRLPAKESAVRRYARELWVPFNRDLEASVDTHALANDTDLVTEQVPWALEKLESTDYRIHVAIDDRGEADGHTAFEDHDGDLVGHIATGLDESPSVFDRPDRVVVGDIYVHEPHRGTGLAHDLMGCARKRAREEDCAELVLSVDVDNNRARSVSIGNSASNRSATGWPSMWGTSTSRGENRHPVD